VFERDRGVCAKCGLDTEALEKAISDIPHRPEQAGYWRSLVLKQMGLPVSKVLWHADHILPVSEGGGEGDLGNLRTLCVRCHRNETRELRKRLSKPSQRAQKLGRQREMREKDA